MLILKVVSLVIGCLILILAIGIDQDWPIVDDDARPRFFGIPIGKK